MNTWQVLRQVQYLLREQDWTGSSTSVFSSQSVIISAAPREEIVEKIVMPVAILRPAGNTVDRFAPDLISQEVLLSLGVTHAGDAYGELPVVGGHRTSQTSSKGRGLLEVEEEVFNAIELLSTDFGVVIQLRASSAMQPQHVSGQYLLFRDYLFRADLTADRFYHNGMNFAEG